MKPHIHWHEGLFLQPHHLQGMQRSISELVRHDRRLRLDFPYGLISAELSRDDLENGVIQFRSLHAIMPSGEEISVPHNARPPALDVKAELARKPGTTVYLGLPLYQPTAANAFPLGHQPDPRVKLLYRPEEIESPDENSGENSKPLHVRRLNARLLLEDEDRSDMEVIPLLRLKRAGGDGETLVNWDAGYVPPCVVLRASPVLRNLVSDLAAQAAATRESLRVQTTKSGFNVETLRSLQIRQIMRLRTLGKFASRLETTLQRPAAPPFEYYQVLREFLCDLEALSPEKPFIEAAPYDHDDLLGCFQSLNQSIRRLLGEDIGESYLKVAFRELPPEGLHTVILTDDHLSRPNGYYLGVRTKLDPTEVAKYVTNPDRFKLLAASKRTMAVLGIPLKEERHPPLELPAQGDLHFFRLLVTENAKRWTEITDEKQAVLVWNKSAQDFPDTSFELYMTVPSAG